MPGFNVDGLYLSSNVDQVRINEGRGIWTAPLASVYTVRVNSLSYQYFDLAIELRNGQVKSWEIPSQHEPAARRFASDTRRNIGQANGPQTQGWTFVKETTAQTVIPYIIAAVILAVIVIAFVSCDGYGAYTSK